MRPPRSASRVALALALLAAATASLRAQDSTGGTLPPHARVLHVLGDSTLWPEGIDADPRDGAVYVASVRQGTVVRVAPDGSERVLHLDGPGRAGAALGVRVDAARGALWVTTSGMPQRAGFVPGDSAVAALLRIDPRSGRVVRRWDILVAPGGHVLGDLAVGPRGDVFLTDSRHPVLYRLRPGADTLEATTHPLFRSLQGLAPSPDGRFLYLADYSRGILRVSLGDGVVVRVADAPGASSRGCDGIVLHRGAIVAVQNGASPARIVRFALAPSGDSITSAHVLLRDPALAPEPTIGTMLGDDFVFVANSQWEEYDDAGLLRPGARLERPRVGAVRVQDDPT
jgi:sugar lactone lactonase YvrE